MVLARARIRAHLVALLAFFDEHGGFVDCDQTPGGGEIFLFFILPYGYNYLNGGAFFCPVLPSFNAAFTSLSLPCTKNTLCSFFTRLRLYVSRGKIRGKNITADWLTVIYKVFLPPSFITYLLNLQLIKVFIRVYDGMILYRTSIKK